MLIHFKTLPRITYHDIIYIFLTVEIALCKLCLSLLDIKLASKMENKEFPCCYDIKLLTSFDGGDIHVAS